MLGYLGPYRLLQADAVLVVGDRRDEALEAGIRELRPGIPVVPCALEPQPSADVAGPPRGGVHDGARRHPRRAARGPDRAARRGGRARIGRPRRPAGAAGARSRAVDADVFLTELKAAAVDVVAEAAADRGAELVFLANQPVALDGSVGRRRPARELVAEAIATNS